MAILCLGRSIKINFAEWLEECRDDLWLISSAPQFPLQHRYRYVRQIDSLDDGAGVLSIATELGRYTSFSQILPHSEFDLIRAAQLREYYGLPGQNVESALAYRDKVLMKDYLQRAGIEVAPFRRLGSWLDVLTFSEEHNFPVVIKQVDGCSSKYVKVCRSFREVSDFFRDKTVDGWMVEKFISGSMYHVNGVINEAGDSFFAPCAYINNALDYQHAGIFGSRTIDPATPLAERLNSITYRTISALPAAPTLGFHAEIFHTADDRLILCEIAARTVGSLTGELIEHTWGINIHKAWIQSCAGINDVLKVRTEPREFAASIRVPIRPAYLISLPDSVPYNWISTLCLSGRVGQIYQQATTYTDDVVSAIITGNSDVQLTERIEHFADWIDDLVRWQN
ncbi:ATP-grasp domain-containing protein [Photorhabdus namnaonensis]|uniref:Argininosuccinate lyase n=1 Tax=Photorhabdus namnaonensis TaxID=1851568 RepID=A0A1B8YCJ3_9GAMM|nr:ATP-grasp domain-containing protein [Photorhabdus namnaonensis]OCA52878.1 argininosuccinate lyase [Photorhabdus namnaonensis]